MGFWPFFVWFSVVAFKIIPRDIKDEKYQ